jgi:hypothetical protein
MMVLDDADPALDALYARLQDLTDCLTSQHGGCTMFTRKRREVAATGQDYLADGGQVARMRAVYETILAGAGRMPIRVEAPQ